jgi:hypothetical protein
MTILQFQIGGEYDYNVTYETNTEKQKLQTNDSPTGTLLTAVSNVVNAAIKFCRFENIAAKFKKVTFGYPDSGPNFQLEFIIKTKDNPYVSHALKIEKLDLKLDEVKSNDGDYQKRVDQNNYLVEKIETLREDIKKYIQGERAQKDLPFETGESSSLDDGDDLFEEDEFDIKENDE